MAMSDARVREIFTEMAGSMHANIKQTVGGVLAENVGKASVLAASLSELAD